MDKYEYNLKFDQMKDLFASEKYEAAADVADEINWNRIRNVNALVKAAEVYEKANRLNDSRDVLLLAYDRSPIGRMIIYKLEQISLRMKDYDTAQEYYDEFVKIAPHDNLRYSMLYNLKKQQGASYDELIKILEEYKEHEYTEEWAYELALMYHKAGYKSKCVEACDELILWFGDGMYVEKALELKVLYCPLTKSQEAKYRSYRMIQNGFSEIDEEVINRAEDAPTAPSSEVGISPDKFNTINLQKEIALGIQQIMNATEEETVSDTMDNIKKIVGDIPYLKIMPEKEIPKKVKNDHIETEEEIDASVKKNLTAKLRSEAEQEKAKLSESKSEKDENSSEEEKQITGQMSIQDILDEWEKKRKIAEEALKEADERKLKSAKARAIQEAEDIMERLTGVMPKLDAGYSPKDLMDEKYLQENEDEKLPVISDPEPELPKLEFPENKPAEANLPELELPKLELPDMEPQELETGEQPEEKFKTKVLQKKQPVAADTDDEDEDVKIYATKRMPKLDVKDSEKAGEIKKDKVAEGPGAIGEDDDVEIEYEIVEVEGDEDIDEDDDVEIVYEIVEVDEDDDTEAESEEVADDDDTGAESEEVADDDTVDVIPKEADGNDEIIEEEADDNDEIIEEEADDDDEIVEEEADDDDEIVEEEDRKLSARRNKNKKSGKRSGLAALKDLFFLNDEEIEDEDSAENLAENTRKKDYQNIVDEEAEEEYSEVGSAEEEYPEDGSAEEEYSEDGSAEEEYPEDGSAEEEYSEGEPEEAYAEDEFEEEEKPSRVSRNAKVKKNGRKSGGFQLKNLFALNDEEIEESDDVDEKYDNVNEESGDVYEESGDVYEESDDVYEKYDDVYEVPEDHSRTGRNFRKNERDKAYTERNASYTGRDKAYTERNIEYTEDEEEMDIMATRPKHIKALTNEMKSAFSYFVPIRGMENQLCDAINSISDKLTSPKPMAGGHMIIQGEAGCGKSVLAASFIKVIQDHCGRPTGKIGKINAAALNRKDIKQLFKKVTGGCLIIEDAGKLDRNAAIALAYLMECDTTGILIIMEDNEEGIQQALSLDDNFSMRFTVKVTVPIFSNDELVAFARSYAKEIGYKIEDVAILALHNRISNIQRLDQATTLAEVKDIVDEAVERESHFGFHKYISLLTGKRYAKDDRIVLTERHFVV